MSSARLGVVGVIPGSLPIAVYQAALVRSAFVFAMTTTFFIGVAIAAIFEFSAMSSHYSTLSQFSSVT
ncbi:MAG: hypothetical protein E4H01_09740 [Lysobacterales bacterium]|nr:MAG: hypothetical protein E4H01_09740 [Xanthomonadales bacterium]